MRVLPGPLVVAALSRVSSWMDTMSRIRTRWMDTMSRISTRWMDTMSQIGTVGPGDDFPDAPCSVKLWKEEEI